MISIQTFHDIESFKGEAVPFLLKQEAENNLILGLTMALKMESKPYLMAKVEKDGEPVMFMLQTIPSQAILSLHTGLDQNDLNQVADWLSDQQVPGLVGEKETVLTIADYIKDRGTAYDMKMDQRIYKLTDVVDPKSVSGELEQVEMADSELVVDYLTDFQSHVPEPTTPEEIQMAALRMINEGRLYGWRDHEKLVSVAVISRPTVHNANIAFVYTPPELRGRGYASNCVAELSKKALKQYDTLTLYTDMANPTSNKIYMDIGYEPVCDSVMVWFR
ncbi:GNAT family N-acetyltransferase [Jeotgalibacillus sp. R-1-5s-1]|uniref:GNAT family N-acetyltransferase n=1 Tax=Jeotgalibacillus sp. R-1-5s-1 TaxID=2555897 RepID=UPI00106999CB|nr:GNAT family N-acetyltransferase [Jeotgalibacillus sp. R-1-5s-1]TFE00781.1 GNAT family N-acetyltransferase [Jeotgalibacillus sp. R-1-5s-1]